jgi:hypothetical protein
MPISMAEAAPGRALMHSLLRAKDPTRRVTVPGRPANTDAYSTALERLNRAHAAVSGLSSYWSASPGVDSPMVQRANHQAMNASSGGD